MHSLSDCRVRSLAEAEIMIHKGLGKVLWSVCKFLILSELSIDSAGDKVKVIFDYNVDNDYYVS
jgi:hypothetical protein